MKYILILLLFISVNVQAEIVFEPRHVGAATCADMVDDYSAGYDTDYIPYMSGYMTSVDIFNGGKPATRTAAKTLAKIVKTICEKPSRAKSMVSTLMFQVHQRSVKKQQDFEQIRFNASNE